MFPVASNTVSEDIFKSPNYQFLKRRKSILYPSINAYGKHTDRKRTQFEFMVISMAVSYLYNREKSENSLSLGDYRGTCCKS